MLGRDLETRLRLGPRSSYQIRQVVVVIVCTCILCIFFMVKFSVPFLDSVKTWGPYLYGTVSQLDLGPLPVWHCKLARPGALTCMALQVS